MSKADDIIDLGKKLMENPGTGFKILGAVIVVGGTLYGGKKAIDVAANYFKERQKRKTKEKELNDEANAKISVLDKEAELKKQEHEQKLEEIRLRADLRSSSSNTASSTPEEPNEPTKPEEEPEINIPDARNRRREKREVRYIVPRLISEGEIATIFGHEKIGKSYLGAQIAKDATLGGYSTLFTQDSIQIPKCRVYYYSAENWKDDVADRLPDGFLDEHLNFQLLEVDGYKVDELLQLLRHQLNQDQGDRPILVIIDNLSAIVDSVYSGDIDTLMTELIKIIKDTKEQDKNLTIILFAHDKADRDLASAASVGRKVSTIIRFSEDSKDKDKRHIEIVRSNLRQKASYALMFKVEQKLHLEHIEESEDDAPDVVEEGTDAPKAKRDKAWWDKEMPQILKRVQSGEKQEDIAEDYGVSRGYINTKINQYKKEHPGK
jgi:archaellum biogenesis ATPase FlaH